ncbi:hypothetical protein KAJ61_05355 [Candidatus Parcubacteria bacterium]|nr:hypothetical protein [Candidatus Parcubacteria bacterium]
MNKSTSDKIIKYIKKNGQATANELVDFLDISRQALFKHHLSKMIENKVLVKIGKPPKVFYFIKKLEHTKNVKIDSNIEKIINDNYLIITPAGEKKEGFTGFVYWCDKNSLDIHKTADDYIKTLNKYSKYKKNDLIDGKPKFKSTFKNVFLDYIFYLDFYSIERFGKTKLGQLLLYGKQSGNKKIIKKVVEIVRPKIEKIIKQYKIDAVGFIPWTVKREVQFMRELEKNLKLNKKSISISKIKTEIIVPQKTLSKLNDRIENAGKTIILTETGKYNNILLIDDAVGSGATLNEVAKQIKNKKIAKKVIGLSLTGSFKGFEVISEV